MAKYCLLIIILFELTPNVSLKQNDLDYFRSNFHQIHTEEEFESYFNSDIEVVEEGKRNTIMAYKGACQSMMAKFVISPFTKMKHFKEGTSLLEKSITQEHNVDNIYLRLLVQLNAPRMLSYYENIEDDLLFLQQNVKQSNMSSELKQKMIQTLMSAKDSDDYMESLLKIGV
jgi:hypothetical protein